MFSSGFWCSFYFFFIYKNIILEKNGKITTHVVVQAIFFKFKYKSKKMPQFKQKFRLLNSSLNVSVCPLSRDVIFDPISFIARHTASLRSFRSSFLQPNSLFSCDSGVDPVEHVLKAIQRSVTRFLQILNTFTHN